MGCCGDRHIITYNIKGIPSKSNDIDKNFRSKYYVGEFFLLDKENIILTFEEKLIYLNKIDQLLDISDYYNLYKITHKKVCYKQNFSTLREENHKELFLYLILNIDISIVNCGSSFQNLWEFFKERTSELEEFIFNGPPQIFRGLLWKIFLKKEFSIQINELDYEKLNQINLSESIKKQIQGDIIRTFPNIKVFQKPYCLNSLKSTLENIAKYYRDLEYVQGMNNILGFLILFFGLDKIESFNFAVNLFNLRSNYFVTFCYKESLTEDFTLLFNFNKKFNELFTESNPNLRQIFENSGIHEFLWFSKWFQTLFTYHFDLFITIRIWDIILIKGIDSIIHISLHIIDYYKDKIINLKEIDEIMKEINKLYTINEDTMMMLRFVKSKMKDFIL